MRASAIKDILRHLIHLTLPAFLQLAWIYCAADLLFGYGLQDKVSTGNFIAVYCAAVFLNVILVRLLRSAFFHVFINVIAVILLFAAITPFNSSFSFIASGAKQAGGAPGIFLGLSIIVAAVACWYLGFRLVSSERSFENYLGEFQFGFLIFLIIFFFCALSGADRNYYIPVVVYFAVGMLLLFFSRRESTDSKLPVPVNIAAFIFIILTLACGLVLAVLFNPELADKLYQAGKIVLGFLLDLLRQILLFIAGLFPGSEGAPPPLPPSAPRIQEDPEAIAKIFSLPPFIRKFLQIMVTGIFAGLIIAALWSISRQIMESFRRRKTIAPVKVTRLRGSFLKEFFILLENWFAVWGRKIRWLYIRFRGRSDDDMTMKYIYGQILRWAAMDGLRIKISQTPDELYPELALLFPQAVPELDLITRQFARVRYGEMNLNEDDWRETWNSYNKIKQLRRRLFLKTRRK